ncbi:periplasmic serine protease (DegP) [Hyphomicrobium denitrificans 1NES1]|uniref:Probable periplasmic serine endoprotease DegP-like n=1 Tax=Hyphomicrobium denitrificans 1NES1 TaxID=670307 RepID=N0B194_9HYPH|nr:Do family serine endopeptidase [Hyphomicrobium denitrificans]AGK57254.1 periplasmic serine protease (DegP) [Hyphomicrobium denitrificans 1NES1]
MDLQNPGHNEIEVCGDGSPRKRKRRFIGAAGVTAAGGAAIAFLVAAAAVPVASPLSHVLALSGSAAAAEAASPPAAVMPSFANLVEKVKPAVVSIYVRSEETSPLTSWEQQGDNDEQGQQGQRGGPFQFFFGSPDGPQFGLPNIQPGPHVVRAQGSGFFITGDGYLVTNNHVVKNAKKVEVRTTGGKTYTAKIIGTDPKTDLALLKVDASEDFPHVAFASTLPKVGDWVVAMGNPFGLGGTVTAGIVSAQGRDIGSGPYDDYIQIDAPVNSGNSGGPTFNLNGEVIGINTAIYSPSGGSVGIAFDIPSTTAKSVVDQIKSTGKVTRGWIGVTIQPVTDDIAASMGLKSASGAIVDEPQSGGPAAEAGLKSGDVITHMDGMEVKDSRDLARKVGAVAPGQTIKLTVVHNGKERTVELTARSYPSDTLASNDDVNGQRPEFGMMLAPSSDVAGARADGVVVTGVNPGGVASEKGVQQGDVITAVGGKSVSAPRDVQTAIREAQNEGKSAILLHLKTADGGRFVALPLKQG